MSINEIIGIIFGLFGGLGLFLFGMGQMSDGLQKMSGDSLKKILEKITGNRVLGTGVGAAVTVAIQSSSATTVMVVGFVNAGLMNLTQALSVILGANVGTTITAQIIAFKITAVSMPAIAIGVFILLFIKQPKAKYIGEIIFGFGLLFFGMDIMTTAFLPLSKSEELRQVFIYFGQMPLLAVLAGALTTLLVQSSSATIGITIALASTGVIGFPAAAALVLGENIGTTVTANLAAINANRVAKQAALGHFLFNVIGVTYMMIFLHPFLTFINYITPGDVAYMSPDGNYPNMARHIANIHTMFNIVNMIIFLPFLPFLAKLCQRLIKEDKIPEKTKLVNLTDALTSTPEIAVGVTRFEIVRMFKNTLEILACAKEAVVNKEKKAAKKSKLAIENHEIFNKEIAAFIDKLRLTHLSDKSKIALANMTFALDEIYQMGERAEKLIKTEQKLRDKDMCFSEDAKEELDSMFNYVYDFSQNVFAKYGENKRIKEDMSAEEETIDKMRKTFKKNHIKRLNDGQCTLSTGLIYVDMLNSLEKIGDNTYGIAQTLINKKD